MSITATERTQIVELTTLMFNAAPGATYLSEIVAIYEANGRSLSTLANLLAGTGVYNSVYPNTMTSGEFAAQFLATVGLSTDAFALDWVTSKLNAGMSRGQVVFAAFNALNNVISADPAQYQAAKAMLLNKTAVSEFYSDPAPTGIAGTATDLVTLQSVVGGVTADASTVATAEAALTSAVNANVVLKPTADTISSGTNVIGDLSPFFFNGVGPTLNSTDAISNVKNLTITDQFGTGVDIIPAGITLSNIQNVSLQTAGNAGGAGQAFDTSGISGVTTLTVNSSGAGGDFVTAAATTDITMSQTNQADGTVFITGGNNVTLTAAGAGGSIIGSAVAAAAVPPTAQLPAGNVSVTDTSTAGGGVKVYGGKAVTVSVSSLTNSGAIAIGNTAGNTGNISAGGIVNPTGAIKVTSIANVAPGAMTIFGGTTVDVTAAGNVITVGDATAKVASNEASGAITISDQQPTTYDNLKGTGHTQTKGGLVSVFGGTDVGVNTNTGGGVVIGADNKAATLPKGAITVVDSASNLNGAFGFAGAGWPADLIMGGTSVDVTAAGGAVWIGSGAAGTTKTVDNPTGAVTVTETGASHQAIVVDGGSGTTVNAKGQGVWLGAFDGVAGAQVVNQASPFTGKAVGSTNAASNVIVDGGTTVTVNTTGGNVFVGSNAVVNGTRQVASDNVTINNTFSGADTANAAVTTVLGGKAVNITYANGTSGAITVGAAAVLDSTGTALTNGALDASGDVTIANGSSASLGTAVVNVTTNGAANVSVTGATTATITDVQTTLATGGVNVGKAIGTSTLTNVSLTSVSGASFINSDALTSLSISDSIAAAPSVVTVNSANSHALALTLDNDAAGTKVNDARATSVTVSTAGTAKDSIILNTAAAKSFTFSNAKSLTVGAGTTMSATGPDTVVANGAGALKLGDTTAWGGAAKLTSIDASAATGAVTATISGDNTTFKGGSGNDSVTVKESFQLAKSIDGGAGTDTVTLTNVATIYNPLLNPTGPISADFANFEVLGLAGGTIGTYDVSGFQGVVVTADAGALNLINAGAAETLTFANKAALAGNVTWATGGTVNVTLDGATAGVPVAAGTLTTGKAGAGATTVNVAATGGADLGGAHTITLTDVAAATKTLNISGDAAVAVVDADGTVKTISVTNSAAVDVTGVVSAAAGMTVTGGAGKLTVNMDSQAAPANTDVDVLTSGSGGVVATIGAGNATGGGSETLNLAASAGVRDKLTALTTPGTAGQGTRAVINGFGLGQSGAIASGDVVTFGTAKTIAANTAAPVAGASGSTYSISNGIVTLVTPVGGLTGLVELADVQGLIDATAFTVGAVTIAGTTYVIASDAAAATPATDTVLQLSGVTAVTGFGQSAVGTLQMGAGSTIMSTNVALINAGHTGSAVADTTFADLGFGWDTLSSSAAGITNTYQNLGNWAELDVTGVAAGKAVVTQVGTAPKELYVKATGAFTLDSLTVDGAVVLDAAAGNATIKSLTAGSATIWVTGANNATISAISDAALTTVDASKATGVVTVGSGTSGITNAGVTFKGGTGGLNVIASGAGDTIIGSNAAGVGAHTIVANGNGDTITLGDGVNTITANGNGDTITVGALAAGAAIGNAQTIHASGVGSTITFSTAGDDGNPTTWTGASTIDGGVGVGVYTVGIGNNSTVNFGTNVGAGSQTVVVTGDFTGATSGGAYSFVTLGNVMTGSGDMVTFNNVGGDGTTVLGEAWLGQVNVASAASLADALDLAASVAALSQQAGGGNTPAGVMAANTGLIDWFQWGGDTYIVEAINGTANTAAHSALGAGDQVIKIVGLVDLSGAAFAGHTVTL